MASIVNKGTKSKPNYHARVKKPDGKWTTYPTHQTTKAAATLVANEMQARITRGLLAIPEPDGKEAQQQRITVRELAQHFEREYTRPKLTDPRKYRRQVRTVFAQRLHSYPLADLPAAAVRRLDLEKHRDRLKEEGYADASVNDWINKLTRAYYWGMEQELIGCANPLRGLERMPSVPRQDYYALNEVLRLLDPLRQGGVQTVLFMIATALYTGLRKGELFGLVWERIRLDLTPMCIEVTKSYNGPTKSKKSRVIPLHTELAPWLQQWRKLCPQTPQGLVFPVEGRFGLRMGTGQDMEDLRELLTDFGCRSHFISPWHAFRHTFSTHLSEAGGADDAVEKILGHAGRVGAVTLGYIHRQKLEYLSREVAKLSFAPVVAPQAPTPNKTEPPGTPEPGFGGELPATVPWGEGLFGMGRPGQA